MKGISLIALFIDNIRNLGRRDKLKLLMLAAEDAGVCSLGPEDACRFLKGYLSAEKETIASVAETVDMIIEKCRQNNIKIITYPDSRYPPLLRDIYDPPAALYVRGGMYDFSSAAIAVVGTRRATGRALKAAYETGFVLGSENTVVVSGLASGIDSEAHRGCLDGMGVTAAVLGNGLDSVYPPANRKLASKILEQGGVLISEYPPGAPPLKHHFPERNRIISGLAGSLILIQAPEKSGALITAGYAADEGRDVYIHRDGLGSIQGAGGKILAENGAEIISLFRDSAYRVNSNGGLTDPKLIEDEILGKIVNNKGTYYRRKVYA